MCISLCGFSNSKRDATNFKDDFLKVVNFVHKVRNRLANTSKFTT